MAVVRSGSLHLLLIPILLFLVDGWFKYFGVRRGQTWVVIQSSVPRVDRVTRCCLFLVSVLRVVVPPLLLTFQFRRSFSGES